MTQDRTRPALRQLQIARRQAFVAMHQNAASEALCRHLRHHLEQHYGQLGGIDVGAYLPIQDEPDLSSVFDLFKGVALPQVQGRDQPLRFLRYRPGDLLNTEALGVKVPSRVEIITPAVLLVPCVGFKARSGGGVDRLGYGGGFYDRTLAEWPGPAIGIAFSCARMDQFEAQDHDRPLLGVITETGAAGF